MAKAKEFKYVKTKELGIIGKANEAHKTIEMGHFVVDGKVNTDKIYIVDHFFKRDGSMDSKANALCKTNEAREIGKILAELNL